MQHRQGPILVDNLAPVAQAVAQLETVPERARAVGFVFISGVILMIGTQWLSWPPLRWGIGALGLLVCLSVVGWVFNWSEFMSQNTEKVLAFIFGVVFVSVLVGVAFLVPEPKPLISSRFEAIEPRRSLALIVLRG